MRLFLQVALIAFWISYAAASFNVAKINSDSNFLLSVKNNNPKRSLRQYIPENTEDDERGINISEQVNDVVSKVDDVVGMARKAPSKLSALLTKNGDEFAEFARLSVKLSDKYPFAKELSLFTLKQLKDIEKMRKVDLENGIKVSKKTPDGMRRKIEPFDGIKTVPEKFLESHVGRKQQLFNEKDGRELAAGVVTRTKAKGELEMLQISSSKPEKIDFLVPKGGWDRGEGIEKAALREVIEEGGVNAQIIHGLAKIETSDKKMIQVYLMKSSTIYDDWSESIRYRLWVSYDEALKFLDKRPHMIDVANEAKIMTKKLKRERKRSTPFSPK